jgi:hypothetical protein
VEASPLYLLVGAKRARHFVSCSKARPHCTTQGVPEFWEIPPNNAGSPRLHLSHHLSRVCKIHVTGGPDAETTLTRASKWGEIASIEILLLPIACSGHLRAAITTMAIPRIAIFVLSLLLLPASHIHGLEVTPNSPCKSKCTTGNATTTENSIVCIDSDYTSTSTGSQFQQCVECELGSKAADPITGTTDVMWGLCKFYGMRNLHCALLTYSLSLSRQFAIYLVGLPIWLPSPGGLLEQPMPGHLRITLRRDRKRTQQHCDNGRLVLLQHRQLFDYNYSELRVLLWVDG